MNERPIALHSRSRSSTGGRPPSGVLANNAEPAPPAPASAANAVVNLQITGMTCGHCAQTVTAALQAVPGVGSANASVTAGTAVVVTLPGLDVAKLLAAVHKAGFGAVGSQSTAVANQALPLRPSGFHRIEPFHLGLVVMILLWASEWIFRWHHQPWFGWVAFLLALPVQLWLGGSFVRGAWRQLRVGKGNMDTLVALGSTAAFGYSVLALARGPHEHLFFTEAVTILTFITLGHRLEARLTERAGDAVRKLLELAPLTARRVVGYQTSTVTIRSAPVASLLNNDVIELAPGDRVPVDAEVLEGDSAVTEAMLTGEALPVEKSPGAKLYAGTLNQTGRLLARVTATGETTALAGIVAAVRRAQTSRAQIQRLADQISSVFVPFVILLALAAAAWWGFAPESAHAWHDALAQKLWSNHVPSGRVATAFYIFCAVLIVACPCALGLATPMALLAGVNAGAQRGILIRDALALEKAGRIDTIAFDKTGTLTMGHPVVAEFRAIATTFSPAKLQAFAATVTQPSRHPLSQAIARSVSSMGAVADWREERGAGVSGKIQTESGPVTIQVGAAPWLISLGMLTAETWAHWSNGWQPAASQVGLVVNGQFSGIFALNDPLRPDATALLTRLVERLAHQTQAVAAHPSIQILSGDRPGAVAATVAALQASAGSRLPLLARGGLSPTDKVDALRRLQAAGHRVAFIGDGLNDGPVLAQANLGLAVTSAADVAREAADIVLLRPDLGAVAEALELAVATRRNIWQNLAWASIYNLAALPLAVCGLLHPVICALAMGLSDVFVVGNALRLRRWQPGK